MSGTKALIRLEGMTKTYQQGELAVEVLKGIDLQIAAGEFVALQGPSGSGKSTLMHLLGLLDRPSAGRYWLQGEDVAGLDDDRLSELRNRLIGFLFQTFYLVPYLSALENVVLPGLYSPGSARHLRHRAEELLVQVGLGDRLHFKPSQLSGGQQQRVGLARALVNDPQVLLADEPTGQLDSATSAEIMELIAGIHRQGRTVVLVTHDASTAACAERSIFLHDGRVVHA
ncbi:MAG TPA: ABC transporter ATP-binding protein [Desulfuromonadales bacterium]|nr:ABC transporter ATP-binding protein [Desulfuromonadales bacterium]